MFTTTIQQLRKTFKRKHIIWAKSHNKSNKQKKTEKPKNVCTAICNQFSAQSNYWGEAVTQIIGEDPENNPQDLDIFED